MAENSAPSQLGDARGKGKRRAASGIPTYNFQGAEYEELLGPDDNEHNMANERPKKAKRPSKPKPPKSTPPQAAGPSRTAAGSSRSQAPEVPINPADVAAMNSKIANYKERADDLQESSSSLGLSQSELDTLVAKVVRYMLFKTHEKPGVPVQRKDLVNLIKEDYKGHKVAKKLPGLIIPLAQAKMIRALGVEMRDMPERLAGGREQMEVEDVEDEEDAAAAPVALATGLYVLRSVLPANLRREFVQDKQQDGQRGLLMVVLALIKLAGGKMDGDELWRHLGQLGVSGQRTDHPVLGNTKLELDKFEKQKYLDVTKKTGAQGQPETCYTWGCTAYDEVGCAAVDEFVDKEFKRHEAAPVVNPDGKENVLAVDQ